MVRKVRTVEACGLVGHLSQLAARLLNSPLGSAMYVMSLCVLFLDFLCFPSFILNRKRSEEWTTKKMKRNEVETKAK